MKPIETYHNFSKDVLDIFEQMKKTEQSYIHHAEGNVYVHTNMVVDEVEKIKNNFSTEAQERFFLYWYLPRYCKTYYNYS